MSKQAEIDELEGAARDKQLLLLERQLAAVQARDDLLAFTQFTMPDPENPNDATLSRYQPAQHHRLIAAALEAVERGEYQFLILTTAPRHGKSELVSRRLPAWLMGRHPEQNLVVATYNDDFAGDFGAEVRSIMQSPAYKQVFPAVSLVRGGAAKDRLQTRAGGQATFVGVGGALTGRGAHCLIIDDLIKSYEEARSQAFRDRAWEWFTKVAMTRRMGRKSVIITFTRWHSDDIIGRLVDPENPYFDATLAAKIKIIELPAIAGDDDPMGREPGTALWPGWYDLDFLEEQRRLDPTGFEALYQQRPTLADGDVFRRENIQFYDPAAIDETNLRVYCASDHAVSVAQRADPTVLLRAGVDKAGDIYLLDAFWKKAPADEVVEAMLTMGSQEPRPLTWWAERGHISKSIGPFLKRRMLETQRFFNVVEVTPSADKLTRAQSISARVSMGKVFFPRGKWWTEKAINEMLAFPNGLHDDFVDALAYIGLGLQGIHPGTPRKAGPKPPKSGTMAWIKAEQAREERAAGPAPRGGF